MALKTINPTTTKAWSKLQAHFETIEHTHIKELFAQHTNRADDMTITWEDFYVDYSKHRISKETLDLLIELANEVDLKDAMHKYFGGDVINKTEGREVLHTALRNPKSAEVIVDEENVMPTIFEVKQKIKDFSNNVIDGDLK
jgi:glucose-6-phosphate isomerase